MASVLRDLLSLRQRALAAAIVPTVDAFGIALLAGGMSSLQYVLEEGNRDGWFESTTSS